MVFCYSTFRTGKPVRCMLDRDEDMLSTGTRHPFLVKYKVIDHAQTMVILLLNHGRPWLETVFNHGKMVEHGLSMVLSGRVWLSKKSEISFYLLTLCSKRK